MREIPEPSELRTVNDQSVPRDPFRPLAPDSRFEDSGPVDVDDMVSSFLSELNTLSDALKESPPQTPGEEVAGGPAVTDASKAMPLLKPAAYRNIDVLLMDNRQPTAEKKQPQDKSPLVRPADDSRRRMIRLRRALSHYWGCLLVSTHLDRLMPSRRKMRS